MINLNFKRTFATSVVVFVLIFACVNLIIFGYAFWLGFQVQGTPDPEKISAFAEQNAALISVASSIGLTFLASIWTTRKVNHKIVSHCVSMAACVAVLLIIYGILFSETIWHDILAGLAILLFSYLGAKIGMRINKKASTM